MVDVRSTAARLGLVALAFGAMTSAAFAQSMSSNSASYNAGYGRTAGQENRAVTYTTRDANGNQVIVDGIMQTGFDQSMFASSGAGGSLDTFAGVGASASSTAIGNNLVVVTQGNYNTVIVNSQQTNTGNVSAASH